MPDLASYHVLRDTPMNLSPFGNDEVDVNFNPPNDIIRNSNALRPVLSYRVDPSNNANGLVFEVFIRQLNGVDKLVSKFTLTGTVSRTVFEVVNGSDIHTGNQKVIFRINGGTGSASVSDVIMWFHRDI